MRGRRKGRRARCCSPPGPPEGARFSPPGPPEGACVAAACRAPWGTGVLIAVSCLAGPAGPGCHHILEPIQPQALSIAESDAVSFPAGSAVRLVNAYPAPEIRRLRSEGSHHLEIDLRDWTARLASELAFELGRRGVTAHVPDASLAGTSMDPGLPSRLPASPEALPALLVRVTEVQGPDPEGRRGPRLRADIESAGGDLAASFEAGEGTRGFRDALFDLKKKILDDARIQGWIQEKRAP